MHELQQIVDQSKTYFSKKFEHTSLSFKGLTMESMIIQHVHLFNSKMPLPPNLKWTVSSLSQGKD